MPFTIARGPPTRRMPKYYVVFTSARGSHPEGVYISYENFVGAVVAEDKRASWSGRGKIPFARGVECESYTDQATAEEAYRSRLRLAPEVPVPYRR